LRKILPIILICIALLMFQSCEKEELPELSPAQSAAADTLEIEHDILKQLISKPLYAFSPAEIDVYLTFIQHTIPELQDRIKHLARKNLDQPYEIYLLGEYPVEIYDEEPLYVLDRSDCVVFCEHVLAMAYSHNWQSFFAFLQRIRYKDGVIGFTTRNHYGEYDWPRNNAWLAENISLQLAGDRAAIDTIRVNKARFFSRNAVPYYLPEDSLVWYYVPMEIMPEILPHLQTGDIVNVVRGYKNNSWVGHYGFVMVDRDGSVSFLHSTPPRVIEQSFPEILDRLKASNLEREMENALIDGRNEAIKIYNENNEDQKPYENYKTMTRGYAFLRPKKDALQNILPPGHELRLQVMPVIPEAVKISKRDSVLRGLEP
jgi:hypothetical protein